MVVGAVPFGEADRVVRLLSPGEGRSAVLVRGARSARNPHPGLDLGSVVTLTLKHGRGGLPLVSAVDPVLLPRRARTDLERLALLAYGCEVCASLAPEHHEAEKLYGLLEVWLWLLDGDVAPGVASRVALEAKALTFAGLTPALRACARCGEVLEAPVVFDLEAGGAQHARCGPGREVSVAALAALDDLRRAPLAETIGAAPPALRWLLSDFVRHQVSHALKSRSLVEEVEDGTIRPSGE